MVKRLRIGLLLVVLVLAGCSSAAATTPGTDGLARATATYGPEPAVLGSVVGQPGVTGPLTLLTRRTAGPVVLRSYRTNETAASSCDHFSQSCAPEWCTVTGLLITELSTEAIAASRTAGIIGLAPGSHLSVLGGPGLGPVDEYAGGELVGAAEGAPVQLQTVRVSPEVTTVRLTTPDGEDSTAPTDGLATVAVQGASRTGRLVASDAAGKELAGVNLPANGTAGSPACNRVPPAPPAAGEQPADRAAAEFQVRQAFSTAFTHAPASDPYRALTAVENGAPLTVSLDRLRESFPQVADTVTVTTGPVVFTDPRTAAAQFTLSYSGGAPYETKYGRALLVDGHWVVSREAFCGALSYAGVSCPG